MDDRSNLTILEADPIGTFRREVIDRALMHGQMHIDRGIARDIGVPDMEAAESLFMVALLALGEATGEADREAALASAHAALSDWKGVLDALSNGPDSPLTHQCVEVDQGELRTLLRCIGALDWLSSTEAMETMSERQILINLAAEGFACPLPPEAEAE